MPENSNNSDDATRIQPRDAATVVRQPRTKDAATRLSPRNQHAASHTRPVQVGDIIKDRFEITELLGHGGMSMVFRALDRRRQEAQDSTPYVAIKVLGAAFLEHPKGFVALQREARKSHTLAHPNIITVYDFDRDGDTVFMTMEELKGTPLDRLIAQNPGGLAASEAVRIISEIAKGLAYAHTKGIVHSDLKPGNVYVCEDQTVKILDFGIARAAANIEDFEATSQTVFDAGELGGLTPPYASLEMFQHQDPHPSDDVYALGLIGYELLTGLHPFARGTAQEVLEKNLQPPLVKGASRARLKTLKLAVALHRQDRIQNAAIFLKRFHPVTSLMWPIIILGVFLAALGSAVLFQSTASLGPAVAFQDLPPAAQQRLQEAVASAQQALSFGDINGAVFYFNNAYQIHPRNEQVMAGLDDVVRRVLSSAKSEAKTAPQQTLQQIDTLLEYESLAANEKLLEFKAALEGS